MTYHVCVDVGGTFTDIYVRTNDGVYSAKTPTTPDDVTEGVLNAVTDAAEANSESTGVFLEEVDRFIHGTTVATNAIIEDEVADTALITTEGFRDTLTLREGGKSDPYDWDVEYPEPYVPYAQTYGVEERINAEGEIVTSLSETDAREKIARIRESEAEAVAVSLLWAQANAAHEQRIGELLDELAPNLEYSLSHRVNPITREYRRTSSTAINSSLYGIVSDYFSELEGTLSEFASDINPLIITANGGVMGVDEIARIPIWAVDAGPTMLPVAARELVQYELDKGDVIALDMGGTSLDMSVVRNGSIGRSREAEIGDNHILGIEKVSVESIGSGGGSKIQVDEGGFIHVGPESAGAEPGPVCYGRGGTDPTVTDIALVLGYLNEEYFAGGEMTVDRDAAETAIADNIATELDMTVTEAAYAVYQTANQNIVNGIKEVTIERGIDPQQYVLSGGGGALGTHIVPVAQELGIDEILLPKKAGVISSIGGLVSDIRRDFSEGFYTEGSRFDRESVNDVLQTLRSRGHEFFDRANIAEENRSLSAYAQARYPQQVWELEFELPALQLSPDDIQILVDRFHTVHENTYGFEMPEQDIEFLQWRVEATAATSEYEQYTEQGSKREAEEIPESASRNAYFGQSMKTCPAYRSTDLQSGYVIEGPAFIDAETTTIVLPPESTLEVTESSNYYIEP